MWTETSWEKWQKKERKEQFCFHNPSCFQELFLCVYCISAFMLGNMYILCFSLILLYIGYLEFVMVPIPSPLVCNLGYIQLSGRATRAVLLYFDTHSTLNTWWSTCPWNCTQVCANLWCTGDVCRGVGSLRRSVARGDTAATAGLDLTGWSPGGCCDSIPSC